MAGSYLDLSVESRVAFEQIWHEHFSRVVNLFEYILEELGLVPVMLYSNCLLPEIRWEGEDKIVPIEFLYAHLIIVIQGTRMVVS